MPDEKKNTISHPIDSKKVNKKKKSLSKHTPSSKTKRRSTVKKPHFVQSSIIEPNSVSSAHISPLHTPPSHDLSRVDVAVAQTIATSTKVALGVVMISAVFFAASLAGIFTGMVGQKGSTSLFTTSRTTKSSSTAKVTVPTITPFENCSMRSKNDFSEIDPATWQAVYDDIMAGDYSEYKAALEEKFTQYVAKLKAVQNNPEAKRNLDIQLSKCMVDVVRSLDTTVVDLWTVLDAYERDENAYLYVNNLNDADLKLALAEIHEDLVDRTMQITDPNLHNDVDVDSYEEMYEKLINELQNDDAQSTNLNAFPYKFAIISSDLFVDALPLDYSWQISTSTAYATLPAFDVFLKNTQFLTSTLSDLFYGVTNENGELVTKGDVQEKQDSFFYRDHNIPYGVNTLAFAKNLVGSHIDYSALSGDPDGFYEVDGEVGAARYERCESLLYGRYITHVQQKHEPILYTDVTAQAKDLASGFAQQKSTVQSLYFVQALTALYDIYQDPNTGKISDGDKAEFAAQVVALAAVYKTRQVAWISFYLNILLDNEYGSDEWIMPEDMATQFVSVVSSFLGEQVAAEVQTLLTAAMSDGIVDQTEQEAIMSVIREGAKTSSGLSKRATAYYDRVLAVMNDPYTNSTADLGNYNACKFNGVGIIFSGERPNYLPTVSKYQPSPTGLMKKAIADTLISRKTLAPMIESNTSDAVINAAASKAEDLQAMMYIAAGVMTDYMNSGNKLFEDDGSINKAFMTGLISEMYAALDDYNTPALNILYEVSVNGKTLKQVAEERLDETYVDEYAISLLTQLVAVLESQGYSAPVKLPPQ